MMEVNVMPKSEFSFWFTRIQSSKNWEVTTHPNKSNVGILHENGSQITLDYSDPSYESDSALIIDAFLTFQKSRPEYRVGDRVNSQLLYGENAITDEFINQLKTELDLYILACCYMMYDDSDALKYYTRAIKWLETTDFYRAPASTKYHDSVPSGLLRHTLKVVDKVIELVGIDTYKDVNLGEAILAAICHDFCKINVYEPYQKNVKNEQTGLWEQQLAYRFGKSDIPLGHGVTSMFIAMKLFKLTTEQCVAIRWHMNEYNVCDAETYDLMDANEKYRMSTLLQTADRLSLI